MSVDKKVPITAFKSKLICICFVAFRLSLVIRFGSRIPVCEVCKYRPCYKLHPSRFFVGFLSLP